MATTQTIDATIFASSHPDIACLLYTSKLEVEAHAFSKTATAAIEAAGGTVVKL